MQKIAEQFFQMHHFRACTPLGNGNINDTYLLDYELDGAYFSGVLQRLNHQVFPNPAAVMDNTTRVCTYLHLQPYPYRVIAPLATTNGSFLHQDEVGNYWRAFPLVENAYSPEGISDPNIAFEAATAYGAFARALRNFPADSLTETIVGFHDTERRWANFLAILSADAVGRVAETQAEIAQIWAAKPIFDRISNLKNSGQLPIRAAHNDTKAGNILLDKNTHKALAVIDLDTVMPGTLLSDFGDMVRSFTPDRAEDATGTPILREEILDALLEGYLAQTHDFLHETERKNLMLGAAWMAGEQCLRFLSDWLAGDVYYKTTFPQQNLHRARNQAGLFNAILPYLDAE